MDEVISQILFNYRIKHLHMDGYTIHAAEPLDTVWGPWALTHIEAHRWGVGKLCPECFGRGGHLESGEYVTAGCRNCGAVFKFRDIVNQPARPER